MARVQLVIPDKDKARFVNQAQSEGLSLSAWLRSAARDRFHKGQARAKFKSVEEMREFWEKCDAAAGPGREPDWEEHLKVINASRMSGLPNV